MTAPGFSEPTDEARAAFQGVFGGTARACGIGPGRVELLGNHTDYNGGRVLTAAIDRAVVVAGGPRAGRRARVHSLVMGETAEFDLAQPQPHPTSTWVHYVQGVVAALRDNGADVPAFDALVAGNLPLESGLSSSAALATATAMFAGALCSWDAEPARLAGMLQRAENEFVGVRCGILDPFSSLAGRADAVICLDCATLDCQWLPLGERAPVIVLCDSGTPRSLAAAAYNQRRAECEQAAGMLADLLGRSVRHLCEVLPEELDAVASRLPAPLDRRARHVITENARVEVARAALQTGQAAELGRLMIASHASSRADFENSTDRLDRLQQAALGVPGCLGSRLCGAGWGGSTVSLVLPDAVERFAAAIEEMWRAEEGVATPPAVLVCRASAGARRLVF